ncbi:MAG: Gfo/Idh/MocA family oxidoreductase [Kiritimatiellae bacterium]|nr:Gfo/Idh/MocA family oxidoreductase [Kiritimatiellia bacterium]
MNRREFIKGTAWMAAVAAAGSNFSGCLSLGGRAQPMTNFAVAPLKKIRIAFIGVGSRGSAAVHRVAKIPGCEVTVLCDLLPEQVAKNQQWLKENKLPPAQRTYAGKDDSYKAACDDDGVDLVYIATPAPLHPPIELYALRAGKHVLTEVPGAQTIDQCWEIVETCEQVRRHCMMLENCCYGETEMLAWNLCHQGLLGTLTHAEGGYIHCLTDRHMAHPTAENNFRTRARKEQALANPGSEVRAWGNTYPTHALGPICLYMDMNRGDVMERVVSLSSMGAAHNEFAAAVYKADEWQNKLNWATGDMNTSIIRTAKGRTIMMQNDQTTPRPYSRINLVQGTKGCFYDYPPRLSLAKRPGTHANWLDDKKFAEAREQYKHPLWKSVGEIAKKVGGHGGMDFIMDLRWAYCLQNGLPLDMDVYDLASWSAIVPCTAESDKAGGAPVKIPDFTRGAWRAAKPQAIGDVDLKKMGFDPASAQRDKSQLSV